MELSVVCTVQGTVAASAIEGALRQEGIPSVARGSGSAGWLFPGASGGLGAVDVLFPASLLEEARAVLEAFDEGGGT
jgi:Putative prokaryotic signal transducing protein